MYEVAGGMTVISKSWLPEFPLWQLAQLDSLGAPVVAAGGVGSSDDALLSLGAPARIVTASRVTTVPRVASLMTTPSSMWKDTPTPPPCCTHQGWRGTGRLQSRSDPRTLISYQSVAAAAFYPMISPRCH